jgi:purple acid phosphatase-like protein/Big-like domain-containing protein
VLPAGQAMAYQFAATSGQASLVRVFVDAGTTTPVLRVAVYSDQDGAVGTILSQGSAPALVAGWITVSIPPVQLVQGTRYWVAVLSPVGMGSLNLRQAPTGGSSLSSAQATLAAFPLVWAPGVSGAKSPLAVSVEQVPPAITLTGPADGSIVTGQADLSAVVDDDLPLARFQFLVDGLPVGPPLLSPPYVFTWDSSTYNAAVPHTISATATDFAGRTSASAQVSVQVDHGPLITGVSMATGLTATSARINWTTDVLADGAVEYGLSSAYGASTPIDARPDWRHEMQLTGLTPGAAYHYRVRSRDAYGALAVSPDQVFFTQPAP